MKSILLYENESLIQGNAYTLRESVFRSGGKKGSAQKNVSDTPDTKARMLMDDMVPVHPEGMNKYNKEELQ